MGSNQQLVGLHSGEWCGAFIYLVIQEGFSCSRANKRAVFVFENEALGLVQWSEERPEIPQVNITAQKGDKADDFVSGWTADCVPGRTTVFWNQAEVEETLKRIQSHKGVIGTMVVNAEGIPIRTTLDNSTTVQYAGLLHQLTMKARSTVRDIDPQNDLTFLRIRSKKHEIMVAPVPQPTQSSSADAQLSGKATSFLLAQPEISSPI
ncbi:hypothetical protein CB1_000711002 [Camelus ferus]|nr:hypothetical protein CB1_000711002 [Camelus ferus]